MPVERTLEELWKLRHLVKGILINRSLANDIFTTDENDLDMYIALFDIVTDRYKIDTMNLIILCMSSTKHEIGGIYVYNILDMLMIDSRKWYQHTHKLPQVPEKLPRPAHWDPIYELVDEVPVMITTMNRSPFYDELACTCAFDGSACCLLDYPSPVGPMTNVIDIEKKLGYDTWPVAYAPTDLVKKKIMSHPGCVQKWQNLRKYRISFDTFKALCDMMYLSRARFSKDFLDTFVYLLDHPNMGLVDRKSLTPFLNDMIQFGIDIIKFLHERCGIPFDGNRTLARIVRISGVTDAVFDYVAVNKRCDLTQVPDQINDQHDLDPLIFGRVDQSAVLRLLNRSYGYKRIEHNRRARYEELERIVQEERVKYTNLETIFNDTRVRITTYTEQVLKTSKNNMECIIADGLKATLIKIKISIGMMHSILDRILREKPGGHELEEYNAEHANEYTYVISMLDTISQFHPR